MSRDKNRVGANDLSGERPDPVRGRVGGNRLPTSDRGGKRIFTSRVRSYDGRSRAYESAFAFQGWVRYRIIITIASAGAFGLGIAVIILSLMR